MIFFLFIVPQSDSFFISRLEGSVLFFYILVFLKSIYKLSLKKKSNRPITLRFSSLSTILYFLITKQKSVFELFANMNSSTLFIFFFEILMILYRKSFIQPLLIEIFYNVFYFKKCYLLSSSLPGHQKTSLLTFSLSQPFLKGKDYRRSFTDDLWAYQMPFYIKNLRDHQALR